MQSAIVVDHNYVGTEVSYLLEQHILKQEHDVLRGTIECAVDIGFLAMLFTHILFDILGI
jgi:hypothetical protein